MRKVPLFMIVTAVLSIGCLLIDWQVNLGILLGVFVSWIHYKRMNDYFTRMLANKNYSKGGYFMHFLIDTVLLALPLLCAIKFPQILNVWGVFIGLLIQKICLYIENWKRKE